jgi:membrane-associated protease RseP (regulator of RpoE activity)
MTYTLGIVAFALIILVSVCLHEAGHMLTAKRFGMKVTRYFAGFGPTLWSFRKGETEYGIKAIPLGGFVKIVGMTPQDDDVAPEDEPRAMWRYPVWKRTVVMSAGSLTHFVIGFVLLWFTAAFVGLPNPALPSSASAASPYVKIEQCAVGAANRYDCVASDAPSPARLAGLRNGDEIVGFNGAAITNYEQLINAIRSTAPGPATVTYVRDGHQNTTTVDLVPVMRAPLNDPNGTPVTTSALGVSLTNPPGVPVNVTYGPIGALGQAVKQTGQTFASIAVAITHLPGKIPGLVKALSGQPRDTNGPISVVGASELGGQTAQAGLWNFFLLLAAGLNFFVGVFNLLPLLPLDGGHIAVAWYEKIRTWFATRRNKPDPGRVDYFKLMPITYVVIVIFGAFSALTILADIINPVNIFQ